MLFIPLLFLLGIPSAAPALHSLQYFDSGSSGIQGFPQFVTVGLVNGENFVYYDSEIRRTIPKQQWIEESEGPEYWERETQNIIGAEQTFKAGVEIIKGYFNQTGGSRCRHVFRHFRSSSSSRLFALIGPVTF